ncbi:MAG: MBL fold metallo-hydrolase, partial [Synergistaceae bacterium]|nr:MBL fold metallo-hydrolase [Synergistaceae bacterium]
MERSNVTCCKNGIFSVDSYYNGPGIASIYIIRDGRSAAIVDTAHNDSLEQVKCAMREIGIPDGEVEFIFLTHVHLDHAGGVGRYAEEFPNARVIVHERGARHVVDPRRLAAAAAEIRGKETMDRLHGQLLPVRTDRVHSPKHGDEFRVGDHVVVCLDTPGHTHHHLTYHDASAQAVFSGDAYGMSFMEMTGPEGRCAVLSTSPAQFDPDAMLVSMRLIESLNPKHLYPTHFGEMPIGGTISESLHRQLNLYVKTAIEADGDIDSIRI